MSSDRYVHSSELEGLRDPHIAVHGSFSCMVRNIDHITSRNCCFTQDGQGVDSESDSLSARVGLCVSAIRGVRRTAGAGFSYLVGDIL